MQGSAVRLVVLLWGEPSAGAAAALGTRLHTYQAVLAQGAGQVGRRDARGQGQVSRRDAPDVECGRRASRDATSAGRGAACWPRSQPASNQPCPPRGAWRCRPSGGPLGARRTSTPPSSAAATWPPWSTHRAPRGNPRQAPAPGWRAAGAAPCRHGRRLRRGGAAAGSPHAARRRALPPPCARGGCGLAPTLHATLAARRRLLPQAFLQSGPSQPAASPTLRARRV